MKYCEDPTCWPEPHTYFDHAAPPAEVVARIEQMSGLGAILTAVGTSDDPANIETALSTASTSVGSRSLFEVLAR